MNTWSKTYPLAQGGGVHIGQRGGPVKVVGGHGSSVQVTASCSAEVDLAEYIQVEQAGSGLHVNVKPRRLLWGSIPSIRLEVEVPVGTTCSVESGSGAVEISATGAPVRIETGSGSVKVSDVGHTRIETGSGSVQGRNISGSVTAETGFGEAEFTAVDGSLSIEVGSGAVSARQIHGDLRVETGSGGVNIRRVRGGSLSVESGGGAMVLKEIDVTELHVEASSGGADVELLQIYPGGKYAIETGSGGVQAAIPANADVKVRAEASSGRILRSGLDFRVLQENAGELEAVLNGGRAELTVEAGSGGIRLVPLSGEGAIKPPAAVQVVRAVEGDPALESSDQLRRIVAMVEAGKLTPQEAEELLRALDEEETA